MTKTYQQFLDESPEYMICTHGKAGQMALGFKGDYAKIEKAWFLFLNFDRQCTLHHLADDLSYISTTLPRVRAALKLFLYVNILHSGEVPSVQSWDEERGIFELTQDVEKVTQLAEEDVNHFMTNLKTISFIPTNESSPAYEYELAAA